ncbi:hypothetical protein FRC04_003145 [Tulasnella sp. 424]|nr:hypothetical protein FRC04_003145 [Tulasnella sp. 424]KAG8962621.1 hypothetical protein FRC05_005260 [Tulasnella sp. 425]
MEERGIRSQGGIPTAAASIPISPVSFILAPVKGSPWRSSFTYAGLHKRLHQEVTVPIRGSVTRQRKEVINPIERLAEFASKSRPRFRTKWVLKANSAVRSPEVSLGRRWQELCRTSTKLAANLNETKVREAVGEVAGVVALGKPQQDDRSGRTGREILELKTTVNDVIVRLRNFGEEVSRASLEVVDVGQRRWTSGRFRRGGEQLTNNFNKMRLNLTLQVRCIATAHHCRRGRKPQPVHSRSKSRERRPHSRLPVNTMVQQHVCVRSYSSRSGSRYDGRAGRSSAGRRGAGNVGPINNVNETALNLAAQVRSIANVTKAVARQRPSADRSQSRSKSEMLDLKNTVKSMVRQFYTLTNEVTRVRLEVGMKGNLGGASRGRECGRNVEGLDK